ncbi:MAG: hypothetical protein ACRDGJ_09565 [Candidatus Limnocylindria bacterium]
MPSAGRIGSSVRLAWLARLAGEAMALYVRLVAATCRVSGAVTREQVVLTFWHEFNLATLVVAYKLRGDLPHASFSTEGFRGVVITTCFLRLARPGRALPLPPESDRAAGRDFALRLARLGKEGYSVVVTPDGPFGPYRTAKPGALIVARASSLPIVPWAFRARPSLRLTRRWDRQLVPLPFGRLRVSQGTPVVMAPRERVERRVADLQAELDSVTARAAP